MPPQIREFSATDKNFWLMDSPVNRQEIALLTHLQGAVDVELIRERMSALPSWFPRLLDRAVPEKWLFVPGEHKPEEQFEVIRVPGTFDVKAIERESSRLLERGVERTKPLWKFYLLLPESVHTQVETVGSYRIDGALLLVGHHSFADGLAGMELVSALSDGGAIARGKIPKEREMREDTPKTLAGSRHTAFRAVKEVFSRKLRGAFHGENSSSRTMHTFTMPLDRLEAISKERRVTLNDVYLASIARAVYFYEARRHSEAREHRVIVPVSVRPISARRAMGNYLTGVAIRLPSGKLETSALLSKINVETKRLKETGAIATYSRLAEFTGSMPPRLAKIVCKFLASKTSFICTNIPDSPKHRYIAGAKICSYFPYPAPLHNQGVAFGLVTYAQTACFSYVVDPAIIDGPLELREDLEKAIESLGR